MLISTALLLDSNIRNSVCTPAKLPCRQVVEGDKILVDVKDYLVLYVLENNLSTSSTFSSTDSIIKLLFNLKLQLPTIRRLPKACRHLAADELSSIINNCLSTKSISSFENLLLFSYRAFNVAEKSDKSLNKHIRDNLSNFEVPQIRTASKKRTHLSLSRKVEAKVADVDIKGTVNLANFFFPDVFKPGDNEQNVRETINSFPVGSSPGLDGMKPQYLKDIISLSAGEAGLQALRILTKLCNFYYLVNFLQKFVIYYMVRLYVSFIRKMEELDRSL
jgi:hypothetical protein